MKNLLTNLKLISNRVFVPEEYKKFLDLVSRFSNMNLYNLLLLYYQMPTATLVAGQNAWKDNYNLDVKEDARAIGLLRPAFVDEEETTLGYAQIGVFDVSQLKSFPEIKKEEFSISEFFYENTGLMVIYDKDGMIGDKEFDIIDDEFYVKINPKLSEEDNEKKAAQYMIDYYVDQFSGIEGKDAQGKLIIQSVKYVLCARYDLPLPQFNHAFVGNCKAYGLDILMQIIDSVGEIVDMIENKIFVELNFAEIAFINLLSEANAKEEYEELQQVQIEDDDYMLTKNIEEFVEKLANLQGSDFQQIFTDRENRKTLTQPPYKIKLLADA